MKEDVSGFFNYLEIQRRLPRNGPGHEACTKRALNSIPYLYTRERILDIGYGNGLQTIELARQAPNATIKAVDVHDPSISSLSELLVSSTLQSRIKLSQGSLDLDGEDDQSFDLLWCESAVPSLGINEGLQKWRRVLKPDGCLGFIDICWLAEAHPEPAAEFWRARYPEMKLLSEALTSIEAAGYQCLNWFILPEYAWWDEYLTPLDETLSSLREKIGPTVDRFFGTELNLIDLCRDSDGSYAAVFFTAKPLTH